MSVGGRSSNLSSGEAALAADPANITSDPLHSVVLSPGQVHAPVTRSGSHHQGAVGEVGFVLAAERNLALLHGDSDLGLVGGVVVMGTAGVHPSVLIFRHCNC